jgi:hypothetical protein
MLADSPFALATPAGPEGPKDPPWSANLRLGPVYRLELDGKEVEYAVVKSAGDISGSFTLSGHEDGPDGIQLVKIEWADDITKTKAVVKKGTEFATLEADQSTASAVVPQPPPRPNGQPGLPVPNAGANANLPRRQGQLAVPQPLIPRPSAVPPAAKPAPANPYPNNQNNQSNPNERKRIRVINSQ